MVPDTIWVVVALACLVSLISYVFANEKNKHQSYLIFGLLAFLFCAARIIQWELAGKL